MNISKISKEENHFDDAVPCPLYDNGLPEVDSSGQPVVLQIVSEYSKPARRIAQVQKQQVAALIRRYGSWDKIPQADLDAMSDARTAACIAGWTGFEEGEKNAPFPYSTENAVAVVAGIREHKPDTLKQVEGAIAAHASFFTTR